jgi:hypothetical protein
VITQEQIDAKAYNLALERICDLEEALQRIVWWADAYPLDIFPVPAPADLQKAHEVLKANGMTIDAISAYSMRHALRGVGDIAKGALGERG